MTREPPSSMPAWARPIRVPASMEITHTEPPFALACEGATWEAPFTLSKDIPAGQGLFLQIWGGRNNKGVFRDVRTEKPVAASDLAARLDDGTPVPVSAGECEGTFVLTPSGDLRVGQVLTVTLGNDSDARACRQRTLNKLLILYTDAPGAHDVEVPDWAGGRVWTHENADLIVAVCTLHILGGAKARLRAYVPSTTRPGEPFAILIRPEDEPGNLSHEPVGEIAVSLDGKALEATLEAVPDSTCVRAVVTLHGQGVHRLRVQELNTALEATANPIVCSDAPQPAYWGMIHGHTEMSDGTGKLDQYFHQLKNEVALDFAAPGDHDHFYETSEAFWRETCDAVKRWHRPGEFVTFLGYEWAKWRKNGDADRNVYFLEDDRPLYRSDEGEYPAPPDLFAKLKEEDEKALVIPHHPGHAGNFCDWKDHCPDRERLVEIFQMRASYECTVDEGNPRPEPGGCISYPAGTVRNALALGWRVGFTAGGDDHSGAWGTEYVFNEGNKQGLMCVEAPHRTREAIFDAMHARRVTATTGTRMLLTWTLDRHPMGSELTLEQCPGLATRRTLSVACHGTAPLDRIDIIRNNEVVYSTPGEGRMDMSVTWEDAAPLDDLWLPPTKHCDQPFAFYYVRALQTDSEIAWASPLWISPHT